MKLLPIPAGASRRWLEDRLAALLRRRDTLVWECWRLQATNRQPHRVAFLWSEFRLLQQQIRRFQDQIDQAIIRETTGNAPNVVGLGSRVMARWPDGDEAEYHVVTRAEADLLSGRLAYDTPVAQALLGKRRGEVAAVPTPAGSRALAILIVA